MRIAIIMYGPTAVGKTTFSEMLARAVGGEIINADAAQLYTPLTIGTAKPDWQQSAIPHHLFDTISEPINYSVAAYRRDAEQTVSEISTRGKVPIFVGGSGFYIHSLFFPVSNQSSIADDQQTITPSWEALHAIDPVRAAAIHPHDTYRITRALILYQQTNQLPSSLNPQLCLITPLFLIELTASPDLLQHRIKDRITQMLAQGWIEEAESLLGTPWEPFVLKKKWIGYPELIAYGKAGKKAAELPAVEAAIHRATWRYARRQMAYARMLADKIKATGTKKVVHVKIDLTSQPLELYLKQLTDQLILLQKGFSDE